jgi:hypothetical protein
LIRPLFFAVLGMLGTALVLVYGQQIPALPIAVAGVALDDLMADNAEEQETEEVDLLAEILEETNLEAKKEEDTESDSRFDALSSEMFGNEDKK